MRSSRRSERGGQALVMVALALTVTCGFLAFAVDLGLAFSVRKSAQAAADAAALAGARNAFGVLGSGVYTSCPSGVVCQALLPCGPGQANPPTSVDSACLYALQNGFSNGGNNGDQSVSVESGITSPSPFAPGVATTYWIMVQVSEQIPQIFAGVLNNSAFSVHVSSVAAIVQVAGSGSASTVALVQ